MEERGDAQTKSASVRNVATESENIKVSGPTTLHARHCRANMCRPTTAAITMKVTANTRMAGVQRSIS
jgi:hypothetical protein